MLEDIPRQLLSAAPVRFQSLADAVDAARATGVSEQNLESLVRFLHDRGRSEGPDSYLDRPFAPKRQFSPQSRFSDGSYPVFYSALDEETARAEIIHLRSALGQVGTAYYRFISCRFEGHIKDLCDRLGEFPYLVQDRSTGAYDRCNEIGREARAAGLDGLRTISAQRSAGECLPVFQRAALSSPNVGVLFSFALDPTTGSTQVMQHQE